MVIAVIPARYGSTRLSAKPLADINGLPMIQRVVEGVRSSRLIARTIVATDDERIAQVVHAFGGEVVMTSVDLQSGTDRVAAVAKQIQGDIFVNVQGDEPLIDGSKIDPAIQAILEGRFSMTSLRVPLQDHESLMNPNCVKVIVDDFDRALYFSRYPIPYSRIQPEMAAKPFLCSQHVGVYAFTRETLLKITSLPATDLERAESLEQLRAMKAGVSIGVMLSDFESISVDTPDDLERVRRRLSRV